MRVCFVCLGNICRSPAAEAVLRTMAAQQGVAVEVDSAGTADFHVGELPHQHTVAEARRRGYPVAHRGRQFEPGDFAAYDLVVALDTANEADLLGLAPDEDAAQKVVRLGAFVPGEQGPGADVPDPWGLGPEAYQAMFDQVEQACSGLVGHVAAGTVPQVLARRGQSHLSG